MADIRDICSVCSRTFAVVFRYQMEERDGGFVYFCSQTCLAESHVGGRGAEEAACDACATRFRVALASQVVYLGGRRRYACSMGCRGQLAREAGGMRLGEIASQVASADELASAPKTPSPSRRHDDAVPAVRAATPDADGSPCPTTAGSPAPSALRTALDAVAAPQRRPRTIAVFNHKGGTGKTTTSVNLAAGLAARGHRVLLVDTDSQGNVAVSLGASAERSLYHVLVMGLRATDAIQKVRPGLDLLPSNETLAAAELYLAGRQGRDRILAQRLEAVVEGYDYIVIDCSPSLSLLTQNALVLADSVLVPVGCDFLSLVGVRQVIKTVKSVNTLLRHPLQIWGVLPTFFDGRARICHEALATLRNHFGTRCLAPIRATTKLKEAPAQARSIFEHAPGTNGAADYAALIDALVAFDPEAPSRPAFDAAASA